MTTRSVTLSHREQTASRRVLRAATWITAAALLVKLAATGKELLIAERFGAGALVDAFLLAFLIPNLLANLFAESMNQALVPAIILVRREQGSSAAMAISSIAIAVSLALLVLLAVVLALLAPHLLPILFHLSPSSRQLTIHLFRLLLPFALLAAIASNGTAILNAAEHFAVPALAPVLVPLSILVCLLLAPHSWGILALAAGTLAGALLWAVLILLLLLGSGQPWFTLRWSVTPQLRRLFGQYANILLSSLVASGGLIIDLVMASWLTVGSVAALNWGSRFSAVGMTILGSAVATSITPYLAQRAAEGDWVGCRQLLRQHTLRAAAVTVPIAALLLIASRPLIVLAFQHGAFHAQDTQLVAAIQSAFALQIPLYVVSRIYYRFLLILQRSHIVLACGLLNLLLDIVFNLVLMRSFGVVGIALATSLWMLSTFLFLAFWARRLLHQAERAATLGGSRV